MLNDDITAVAALIYSCCCYIIYILLLILSVLVNSESYLSVWNLKNLSSPWSVWMWYWRSGLGSNTPHSEERANPKRSNSETACAHRN